MALSVNWRFIYFLSIGFRFVFALSDSYIHPDEHFQSLEVLAGKIFNFSNTIPWEFQSNPVRSYVPLYVVYGPILYLIKLLGLDYSPLQIWYLVRIQNVILGWLITDYCLYRMLPNKPERIKSIYFTLTSFITLVYQSHCFSNSIETYLVLMSILIIDEIRSSNILEPKTRAKNSKLLVCLGGLISFGIFNRITFPAFLILPSWYLLCYLKSNLAHTLYLIIGLTIPTTIFIIIDSLFYSTTIEELLADPFNLNNYTVTPLNNILYNIQVDNLKLHGYHPRYTHFLINLLQILGPGIFLAFYKFKNAYWKTTPFLGALSGLCFLSIFPHQELRFLIPIVPLLCSCFDLKIFSEEKTKINTALPTIFGSLIINSWYIFNILMAILMGIFHQGGVIPVLDHFQELNNISDIKYVQVWWRTYSPPTWMLGLKNNTLETLTLSQEYPTTFNIEKNYVIDAMGADNTTLVNTLQDLRELNLQHTIYLITPSASFNVDLNEVSNTFQELWSYKYHLDMDHLDFSNTETLRPGISVYELI